MNINKSSFRSLIGTNDVDADMITSLSITNTTDISSSSLHTHELYIDNVLFNPTGQAESASLTGISYSSVNDTTTIDNNLVVSKDISSSTLHAGAVYINGVLVNTNESTSLTGISYNSTNDTTTIDNNLVVSKDLTISANKNLILNGSIYCNFTLITPIIMSYLYDLSGNAQNQINNKISSIVIGTVSTLSSGSQSYVNVTNTNTICTLDFGIVRGQKGDTGDSANFAAILSGVIGGVVGGVLATAINSLFGDLLSELFGSLIDALTGRVRNATDDLTAEQRLQQQFRAISNTLADHEARILTLENKTLFLERATKWQFSDLSIASTSFKGKLNVTDADEFVKIYLNSNFQGKPTIRVQTALSTGSYTNITPDEVRSSSITSNYIDSINVTDTLEIGKTSAQTNIGNLLGASVTYTSIVNRLQAFSLQIPAVNPTTPIPYSLFIGTDTTLSNIFIGSLTNNGNTTMSGTTTLDKVKTSTIQLSSSIYSLIPVLNIGTDTVLPSNINIGNATTVTTINGSVIFTGGTINFGFGELLSKVYQWS